MGNTKDNMPKPPSQTLEVPKDAQDQILEAQIALEVKEKALNARELELDKREKALDSKGSPTGKQHHSAEVIKAFEGGKRPLVEAIVKGVIYPNCNRRALGEQFNCHKIEDFSARNMKLVK